ncbi:MAG: histidine phosphatase family protein [Sphingomonas bacterium]|nr:histidine phosphatase family protein [Sphingomonas bacterium]
MKTLALLRHGKSSWDDVSLRDFDRPLNKRGRTASELIGAEMKHRGLVFDLVLASPAERVRQTITYVTRGYGQALQPRFVAEIYQASCETLCTILRSVDSDVRHVLMVGHNPALQLLAGRLVNRSEKHPLHGVDTAFPTAALALLELPDIGCWDSVEAGVAQLIAFWEPRRLAAASDRTVDHETRRDSH